MTKTHILLLFLFAGCLSIILSSTPNNRFLWVNDYHDVPQRNSWILTGGQPYRDVFSEHPQLATDMFVLPQLSGNFPNDKIYLKSNFNIEV